MFTAAYVRVSRRDQTVENQLHEMTTAGFAPTATFADEGVSGKVRAAERPAFAAMLETFARLNGDGAKRVVVTKIDRLGRNAEDVLATVRTLQESGVQVIVLALGNVDLTSPVGRLILTTLAAVASMERDLIVERTQAGVARARAAGKKFGRKSALTPTQQREAEAALAEGASINALAKRYAVARGTIRRLRPVQIGAA